MIVGALLISMGMLSSVLKRLPLSPAMFYLPIGYALGSAGLGLIDIEPKRHAELLTTATEIALLISLFTVGLKLRAPLSDRLWWLPIRLGFVAMIITTGLLALAGVFVLGLPLGAAVLLGAILAPTDPILASDVQIKDVGDRDRIRFGLTGEGGMNDGTTYPLVMIGLGLLAVPEAMPYAFDRTAAKIIWGVVAGLASGWLLGSAVAHLVVWLRRNYQLALGMEEFLTLGLIGLAYGAANLAGGIGFIAVFAAGVAVRRIEFAASNARHPAAVLDRMGPGKEVEIATDPQKAPAYMAESILGFNQQLEHIAEFAMVLLLGVLLSSSGFSTEGALIAAFLFLLVRPVSVALALIGSPMSLFQRGLTAWFGIRGVGSLYYLMFALQYQWLPELTQRFVSLVLTVVAISIVVHGISSTPLMELYHRRKGKVERRRRARDVA